MTEGSVKKRELPVLAMVLVDEPRLETDEEPEIDEACGTEEGPEGGG
jgi:hypothetical protein